MLTGGQTPCETGAKVQNKPAAAVAICRRGGASAAYQTLNIMFEMMNMPIVTSQYWNIAYGRTPGEVAQDTEGMTDGQDEDTCIEDRRGARVALPVFWR